VPLVWRLAQSLQDVDYWSQELRLDMPSVYVRTVVQYYSPSKREPFAVPARIYFRTSAYLRYWHLHSLFSLLQPSADLHVINRSSTPHKCRAVTVPGERQGAFIHGSGSLLHVGHNNRCNWPLRSLLTNLVDVAAKTCSWTSGEIDYTAPPEFWSQAQFDAKFQGCTEINPGAIYIAANYTGALVMPDVVSMAGGIYTATDQNRNFVDTPALTSIEAPALISIPSVEIIAASSLRSISFPALTDVQEIVLGSLPGTSIDFTSVTTLAGGLTISGNISRYARNYMRGAAS
jgi:hypothetical protein